MAVRWLRRRGWRILDTNLALGRDEIDIVAESPDGGTISFIEVKSTRGPFGSIQDRVGSVKQGRLRRSALKMVRRFPAHVLRVDVITVQLRGVWMARVRRFENVVHDRRGHASGSSRGGRS